MSELITTISSIMALVGGTAGLVSLIWQITTRKRGTHRITVTLSHAYPMPSDGRSGSELIAIAASNSGKARVTIMGIGFATHPGKRNLIVTAFPGGSESLPRRLEVGESATFLVPPAALAESLMRESKSTGTLQAWVKLATNKRILARPKIPVADFIGENNQGVDAD